MRLLRNASIKDRLTAIIMAASTISVLLTTFTISVIGVYNMRLNLVSELASAASIVGDRNTAALLFNDDTLAANNMQVFSSRRSVLIACLYDADGARFASYFSEKEPNSGDCPSAAPPSAIITGKSMQLMQEIMRDGQHIGSIYIESDLKDVQQYIEKQGYIAFTVTIAVLVVSYLLALGLQRSISQPILSLAATAREVSLNKDYSVRANPLSDGETSENNELLLLTNSFNSMLHEIGEREGRLRQQNIELAQARDEAEGANRAKSQFLANISHELRTPLNAVIGFSSILMNQLFGPVGDPKYLEYSRDINQSGTHLLDIINDILDLAQAEAGLLNLSFDEVNVSKVVQKCVSILTERAEKGKISLTSEVQKTLPNLIVDRTRFLQILLNVISNGVKFTPEGGRVHVSVQGREIAGEVSHFVITVEDTGIGMSRADIEKAFQSFGQVDSDLNRKYEGTGLGLPLTRKLLELHKGTIEVESEPGFGTKVTLVVPAIPEGFVLDL